MRKRFILMLVLYCQRASPLLSETIPPIIVNKPVIISDSQAIKTIITSDDLIEQGANSLSEALQSLGGVELHDTTGNGSQVILSMRGFGSNAVSNTLLLVNGIPLTNPDMAAPDLNAIPLQDIAAIEIIAGSESVLYGDQAVGGIINILTRHPDNHDLSLDCAVGSYNQKRCYGALTHVFKKIQYSIGLLQTETDNYRAHNHYNQTLLDGSLNYTNQTDTVILNYQIANEKMLYPGALTRAEVASNRRAANNDTDFFADKNGLIQLTEKHILDELWILETNYMGREMQGNGVLSSPFTQSRMTQLIKPQLTGIVRNNKIILGSDLEIDQYQLETDFGDTEDHLQKYGLFGLADIPWQKWIFTFGTRLAEQNNQLENGEDQDSLNRVWVTTLSALYKLTPSLHWFVRRAGNFRFPKADEMAASPNGQDLLKTQTGVSYETGIEWKNDNYSGKWTLYDLCLKNEIAFDPLQTPEDPFGTNRNLPPTERIGFTLSQKYFITPKLSLNGQLNVVNARFQSGINEGNKIPLVAESIIRAGIHYEIRPHWAIYIESLFTGSQFPANDDANAGQQNGGYTLYNFNVHYTYLHFSASFKINNIFNKKYYFYTVFEPSAPFVAYYPAPERHFLLSLKYSFL